MTRDVVLQNMRFILQNMRCICLDRNQDFFCKLAFFVVQDLP